MPESESLLRVRDLSLTHAGAHRPSPEGVSLEVRRGEVVLLLGPSGSGKSTLTLALNGLIPQAVPADIAGTVIVGGRSTADAPVAELSADVAMVFQDPDAQLVTGTLLDEVAFALENMLLPVEEVLRRTEEALSRVGLWERRSWNPDRLSGGGRQRLAIACAIAMGSPLIVLDEPTANLDPQGIDDVYDALEDLVSGGERAIILVEHNLDAAMRFATRAIVLDQQGRLAFDGPVADVLRSNTDALIDMGVWLPAATLAGRTLREKGLLPADSPLPLTPEELADAVAHAPSSSERDGTPQPERTRMLESAPLIRTRNLTVRRGRAEILHGVDLDVDAGSLTAIVGANGAGKTTLIQSLAGVVPPPRGQTTVDGLDPGRASPRDLADRIGFVFQNPEHQFIAHTVFDELAHGLRLRGTSDAETTERVGAMLHRFGLEHKADVHPFLLSGGEKRRLSVGTALITRPRVLALDEPTFGQDRARADALLRLLAGLRDEGTTILIVTHDLQLVADRTTHTVVLADGRVHAAGPTPELFATPGLFESAGLRLPALHRALSPDLRRVLAEAAR
ncbi:ABC transporter ATP-binding protein [Microbacterium sp. GXF6406]